MRDDLLLFGVKLPTFHEAIKGIDTDAFNLKKLREVGHEQIADEIEALIEDYYVTTRLELQRREKAAELKKRVDAMTQIGPFLAELMPYFREVLIQRSEGKTAFLSMNKSELTFLFIIMCKAANFTNEEFLELTGMSIPQLIGLISPDVSWTESKQ